MGIDYAAAIWVGLPRKEFDVEKLEAMIEEGDIEVCPPYYDGNGDDNAIAGFSYCVSPDYAPTELTFMPDELSELVGKFKDLTMLDAKVWLSPFGT